jgi:hypothetical protein
VAGQIACQCQPLSGCTDNDHAFVLPIPFHRELLYTIASPTLINAAIRLINQKRWTT